MSRLFFYANTNMKDQSLGVTKKVLAQVKTLLEMGFEVYYTGYTDSGVAIFGPDGVEVMEEKYPTNNTRINRYLRRWIILKYSKKFIYKTELEFEYSYLRFHFFDKTYNSLLKELKNKHIKTIIEAHAYPYKNGRISKMTLIYFIDSIYSQFIKDKVNLVAAISDASDIWGIRTVNIDNSIKLEDISVHKRIRKDEELVLFSVANETRFHGYDKVVRGLYEYYKNGGQRLVKINLVGDYLQSTKKMVEDYDLMKYITFWGRKTGEELDQIYNMSDLGLGAFGYRKNGDSGSCIKTKEYFAKGIPFINGWREPAFDDSYRYVERYSTSNEFIDIQNVIKFYDGIKNDNNIIIKMREFAMNNYSWQSQFEKVFSVINEKNC